MSNSWDALRAPDPARTAALEAVRQKLEQLFISDPNFHQIVKATIAELSDFSVAYINDLVKDILSGGPAPGALAQFARTAYERSPAQVETPQEAETRLRKEAARLKGAVLALVQDARGQPNADQEVWKKVEAWVNEAFAGAPDAQAMYDQIVLGETPWWNEVVQRAEQDVEAGRKATRRKEFDSVFRAQVLGPIAANPLFMGPNGQRHLAAILAQVKGPNGERLKEFADQYEAWYVAELAKDPTGRARLDTIGPLGWLMAEWGTVAKAIAPGIPVGGLVATPQQMAVQIEASTRFAYDLREIRADRGDKAKNELIRYEKALRDAAGKKGLDEEAQFGLRQAANAVLNHRDDLLNGYRDLADVEDPLAYVNRMLPSILRGELVKGDSGLETAVVSGDMDGSLTGIVGLAGQGSTERKQKKLEEDAAAALTYKKALIDQAASLEGENNTFEVEVAYKALEDENTAALAQGKLGSMAATKAIELARRAFKPQLGARKAQEKEEAAAAEAKVDLAAKKNNLEIAFANEGENNTFDLQDAFDILDQDTAGTLTWTQARDLARTKFKPIAAERTAERALAAKQQAIRNLWGSEETPDWDVDDALAALAKEPTLSTTQARAQARTARKQLLPTPAVVSAQDVERGRAAREQDIRTRIPAVIGGQQAAALEWARAHPDEDADAIVRRFGGDGAGRVAARQQAQRETDLAWAQAVTAAFGQNLDLVARARNLRMDNPNLSSAEAISQVQSEVGEERAAPILGSAVEGVSTTERAGGFNPNYAQAIRDLMAVPPGGAFQPIPVAKVREVVLGAAATTPIGQMPGVGEGKAQIGAAAQLLDTGFQQEGVTDTVQDPEVLKRILDRLAKGLGDVEKMWGAAAGRPRR